MNSLLDWAAQGLWSLSAWQIVLFTLVMTHISMISVTIFLHRHQAHRALDLHPIAAHFFRFWLWLTTGQVTKEWASIHRKHHAKCEQPQDPHSPHVYGIKTVLLQGYELYRKETKNQETLARYGHGTPNDWLERNLYSRFSMVGVVAMLLIDLTLFGAAGLAVWAVQMIWTPVMAAGIINGAAHYWGYRNFEAPDASTNISPWGVLIAGEELHNNHHTYPTSAKLSVKRYEFDIGWMYISLLQRLGLASVKKTPPKLALGMVRAMADEQTLEALIQNRFELMAGYAKGMRRAFNDEVAALKARQADVAVIRAARSWLHRDAEKIPKAVAAQLAAARAASPVLDKMVVMREELRQMWLNRSHTREQLAADLQGWCQRAEASGIAALQEFSLRLRSVRA
ncbi:DesA family fatty acid desaturase [Rhodoferax antarcticus]|uniref:Fatty acid desaturase n=1 Tax=Rhodoferax antarcticus ANT.BR TaxID=1111071 RepID=A0A1Q8YAR3_9BURK|nr:fatty acid desaturase [Rhodoferax antarcticus]APW47110.1 acyl-CoA desaturase [Rhodoferax antarcticus]MCW2311544.1 stearoyl-CoA desaturase (delta-9 desaturase) [Rhodoferax antarcticus]OLP04999.1 fatty acid desaturase [Rhodoferax antarcticus ANT.BR]